ncbi:HAD family phosphatase [Candidatus Dojkabacteria bacterium]|nr:HAD family phosphatase [Candidatus Dojkabacteria bacterium]
MFDIDGVLNKHGDNIQNTSKEAIRILRRQGIMVCFASGKHAWYIQGGLIWSGLLRQDTLIVAENGGVIYKPSTRKTILEDKYIQDVQLLRSIFYNLYSKDEGFLNFAGLTVWEEPKETLFCLYPKDAKDVQRLAEILEEIVKVNRLNLYLVENPDSVDVLQKGINKSTGLKHICDWLGVDFDEIIAVGDSYNDIEMLKDVGFGITLENGKPEVKKVVKFKRGRGLITKNSYGEGVLEAVKCLINKRII